MKRILLLCCLALVVACQSPRDNGSAGDDDSAANDDDAAANDDDTATDDDDTVANDDDTVPAEKLTGTAPDSPVGPAQFTALNSDGSERGPGDLQGHPTVLWFFPFAGTPV